MAVYSTIALAISVSEMAYASSILVSLCVDEICFLFLRLALCYLGVENLSSD